MDAKPTVSGLNLTRIFGSGMIKTMALRQASLDLYPGEMALIKGPSGSGKSTLLAALSGLLRPDSGQVIRQSSRRTGRQPVTAVSGRTPSSVGP